MQLHTIQRNNRNKKSTRVGRGGKRGKTAGRGTKGQKARAGHRIRPEIRDVIRKLPKLRGSSSKAGGLSSIQEKPFPVNISSLENTFASGDLVNPKTLVAKGVVTRQSNRIPKIKILGTGTLSKKLSVKGCLISDNARKIIEKAGGSVS